MDCLYRKEILLDDKIEIRRMVSGNIAGKIKLDGWDTWLYKVSGDVFSNLFSYNRQFLYRGNHTAFTDENDYKNAYNLITESGLAGLSITEDGWMMSVYSNEPRKGFLTGTAPLIKDKVKKIVCLVGKDPLASKLVREYINTFEFRIVAVTPNDTEIMTEYYGAEFMDMFIDHWGTPHHVFLISKDVSVGSIRYFGNYFDAHDYVDSLFEDVGDKTP